jgi:hypothetical protein
MDNWCRQARAEDTGDIREGKSNLKPSFNGFRVCPGSSKFALITT